MRTFPKSLATLRKVVDQRGQQLRALSAEELKKLAAKANEQLTVEGRPATIGIIVQSRPDGSLLVVIKGLMKPRFVPGKHVALDGFYKHLDGTTTTLSSEELWEFG